MTRIKFCGLTRPEDAAVAATLGASHVGVVLSESPRQVTPAKANAIFDAAPELGHVAVFRRGSVTDLVADARSSGAGVMQLHGPFTIGELEEVRRGFEGALWFVVPMDEHGVPDSRRWTEIADTVDALVLDTSVAGVSGGTGRGFDWAGAVPFATSLARRSPIVLAGGLTSENVARAIDILHPSIVDVSSGVETRPGIKDPDLMLAFAEAVGSASLK